MPNRTARQTSSSFELIACPAIPAAPPYNPAMFRTSCVSSPTNKCRWSANETEHAMKRTIVVLAVLLASALSAHAAPVKKHLRVANGRACHDILLAGDNAVSYGLGSASGQVPLPRKDCYHRSRETNEESESDMLNRRNWDLGIFN
jgi:hypothetical protein